MSKRLSKERKRRVGKIPIFDSWNLLYLAVLSFNRQREKEGKKGIQLGKFQYFRLGTRLKGWTWCFSDLGEELNQAWDEFCFNPKNKVPLTD